MKLYHFLDFFWKPIKAVIFRTLCGSNYQQYLFLKSKIILAAAQFGLYEKDNLRKLEEIVKPGDSVIDIGAHYGVYSLRLQKLVGQNGSVVAFEPLPEVFSVLSDNPKNFSNVICYNSAISDGSVQSLHLSVPALSMGVPEPALASSQLTNLPVYKEYEVYCMSLDELELSSALSFIKIDVESHEAEVIRGARKLIEKFNPVIQLEIGSSNLEIAAAKKPFGLDGYIICKIENNRYIRLERVESMGNFYLVPLSRAGI